VRAEIGDDSPISPWTSLTNSTIDDTKRLPEGMIVTASGQEIPIDDS
jgi:hypothetical protein